MAPSNADRLAAAIGAAAKVVAEKVKVKVKARWAKMKAKGKGKKTRYVKTYWDEWDEAEALGRP